MGITLKRPVFLLILAIWGGERVKKPRYQVNSHPLGPQGPIRIKNFGMFEIFRKTHLDTGLLLVWINNISYMHYLPSTPITLLKKLLVYDATKLVTSKPYNVLKTETSKVCMNFDSPTGCECEMFSHIQHNN